MRLAVDFLVGEELFVAGLDSPNNPVPRVIRGQFLRIANKQPQKSGLRIVIEDQGISRIVALKYVHKTLDSAKAQAVEMSRERQ